MDVATAREILGISASASSEAIEQKTEETLSQIELKIVQAPTPALKAKYRTRRGEIEEARDVLAMRVIDSLPSTQPSPALHKINQSSQTGSIPISLKVDGEHGSKNSSGLVAPKSESGPRSKNGDRVIANDLGPLEPNARYIVLSRAVSAIFVAPVVGYWGYNTLLGTEFAIIIGTFGFPLVILYAYFCRTDYLVSSPQAIMQNRALIIAIYALLLAFPLAVIVDEVATSTDWGRTGSARILFFVTLVGAPYVLIVMWAKHTAAKLSVEDPPLKLANVMVALPRLALNPAREILGPVQQAEKSGRDLLIPFLALLAACLGLAIF